MLIFLQSCSIFSLKRNADYRVEISQNDTIVKPLREEPYKFDELNGKFFILTKKKSIVYGEVHKEKKVGRWIYFDSQKKKVKEEEYLEGILMRIRFYDKKGKINRIVDGTPSF